MVFIVLALSTVTLDGFKETEAWQSVKDCRSDRCHLLPERSEHDPGPCGVSADFRGGVPADVQDIEPGVVGGWVDGGDGSGVHLLIDSHCAGVQRGALFLVPGDPGAADCEADIGPIRVSGGTCSGRRTGRYRFRL